MKTHSKSNILQRCKRPAGWMIGLAAFLLVGIGIYLCSSTVPVMQAEDDAGRVLVIQQVSAGSTLTSRYTHSVARCPMIEKFEINRKNEIVLKESWNCSFGAGIESQTPEGATMREENGYFIYDQLHQPFHELSVHAVKLNNYTFTIDDQTWNLSNPPFLGHTISFSINQQNRIQYVWGKITAWMQREG